MGIACYQFKHQQPITIATSLYGILGQDTEKSCWSKITNLVTAFATIAVIRMALNLGILSNKIGIAYITRIPGFNCHFHPSDHISDYIIGFSLLSGCHADVQA